MCGNLSLRRLFLLFTRQVAAFRSGDYEAAAAQMEEIAGAYEGRGLGNSERAMNRADKRRRRRKLVLNKLGLSLCAFAALVVLAVLGILLIRSTLLRNARDTGTALSRSFAAEESNSLAMYETLLSFGTASLDSRLEAGEGRESIARFLELYFRRLDSVLGDGVVDPYVVLNGTIVAANPWDGDDSFDYESAAWYQAALAAQGDVIFTDLYTDAVSGRPVVTAAQKCSGSGRCYGL